MKPHYPLSDVKRICAEEDVLLDRARCLNLLTPYIDLFRCKDFAREVAAELTEEDFSRTVTIGDLPFDEYGAPLSADLRRRYEIEDLGNFYVKLRIAKPGRLVFFMSLHELEEPLWRLGGFLGTRSKA